MAKSFARQKVQRQDSLYIRGTTPILRNGDKARRGKYALTFSEYIIAIKCPNCGAPPLDNINSDAKCGPCVVKCDYL